MIVSGTHSSMNFRVYSASKGTLYISANSKVGMALRTDTLLATSLWHRSSKLGTALTNGCIIEVVFLLLFDSCFRFRFSALYTFMDNKY